ncbi:enoyl-CoA hydratase/isomerase family protein [Streptomyces sp. NPDC055078]
MQLLVEKTGPVALLTINRREHSNSLTNDLLSDLGAAVTELEGDPSIRAVVLTGSGGMFSSGSDLKPMSESLTADPETLRQRVLEHADIATDTFWRIWRSPLPFVAAVERMCLGAAVYLTAVFDHVLITPDAEIGMCEIRLGLAPPMFNVFPWMLSYRGAKEFLLTGDVIDGVRAAELGLVTRCAPAGTLMAESMALADRLAAMPDEVVATMKRSVNRRWELAGIQAELEHGVDGYVQDKLTMRPFQRRLRETIAEVGVEEALKRLDIDLGLRGTYIGQK